jgi:hypothetical protein
VLFGLSFVVLGWFLFSLTLSSLFLRPLVLSGMTAIGIMSLLIMIKILRRASISLRSVFVIAALFTVLVAYISEPTVFSGRDQGSIAEAAYRLAQNGQLAFSLPAAKVFAEIYNTDGLVDLAYNFPGFAYVGTDTLITQFPLGYTAWLAGFVSVFDLAGFALGNGLLLFLSALILYSLIRLFAHTYYAWAGLILFLGSFLPSWFAKMTLTENLSLFLFLFLTYSLILYLRTGKFVFYTSVLLSGGLFAFTRLEGFAFLGIALGIMLFSPYTQTLWKTYHTKSIIIPGTVFALFLLRDFFLNLPYYKMAAKGLRGATDSGSMALGGTPAIGSTLFIYGLLVLFVLGFFGILVFIRKKRYVFLLPSAIALPTLIYLFSPNITPDHPWMLRRYLFSVFPTLLFSAVLGIAVLFDKTETSPIERPRGKRFFFVTLIFTSLLLLELPAFLYTFPFAENRGLAEQVATWSEQFSDRDLILVDRFATGDNFAMLSGPAQFLSGKNTVYFFNPEDLDRLDTTGFDRVFLLVPEDGVERYTAAFGNRLAVENQISFTLTKFESLSLKKDMPKLPAELTTETNDILFRVY